MTDMTKAEFKAIFRELPSVGSEQHSAAHTTSDERNEHTDEQQQDLARWEDDGGSVRK